MKLPVPAHILSLKPYVAGKPIEELAREYGIRDAVKLASNENPLGPSPAAIAALIKASGQINRYPDGGADLAYAIGTKLRVPPEGIVLGCGSDDIIGMLTRALLLPGDEVIIPQPSFLMYELCSRWTGAQVVPIPLVSLAIDLDAVLDAVTARTRLIFLCSPNNPTGTVIGGTAFRDFIQQVPDHVTVVIDEAYVEFVRDSDALDGISHTQGEKSVVVLRTFSKAYGLAGMRIGFGVMLPELALILHRVRQPFNINRLAQSAALAALEDDAFLQKTIRLVHDGLDFLWAGLSRMGVPSFSSQANFFLIDVDADADEFYEAMLQKGVIVRSMSAYGYRQYIRINVGLKTENERFLEAFKTVWRSRATFKNIV